MFYRFIIESLFLTKYVAKYVHKRKICNIKNVYYYIYIYIYIHIYIFLFYNVSLIKITDPYALRQFYCRSVTKPMAYYRESRRFMATRNLK